MASLFYRNPRLTILLIGLIFVAGFAALSGLPRQEDPTLARRFANITTFFPGATAERVESLVSEPLETAILELHEVREVFAYSRSGVSVIRVQLEDRYTEDTVDEVWSKVRDKLSDVGAQLPPGAIAPRFVDLTTTAATLVASLVWKGTGPPQMDLLSRLSADLENRLRTLPGTKEVEVYGEVEEEIRVSVQPTVLAAVGVTAAEVAAAISAADTKAPAGQARLADNELSIEVGGEIDSLSRVREVPLRTLPRGRVMRVGDIAEVTKAAREPSSSAALVSGEPGVVVAATMEPQRRVDLWARTGRALLSEFAAGLPRGVHLDTIFDQSLYTNRRLGTLVGNLLLAGLIVIVVLVVMMGFRSALVVSTALPLTVLIVLAEMQIFGVPLHQTSITGLIIAIGLLIDNAIVVVEEYTTRVRDGTTPGDAVAQVTRHLFVPLLASTITTVLAFLPIVLMPGGGGEFVGPISIGVVMSVISSFFLTMTVIAALAGYFVRVGDDEERVWWRNGYSNDRLTDRFAGILGTVLRRPWIGVLISVVLPVIGFAVGQTLVEQFFPANDRNQFQIQIRMPPQASLEATKKLVHAVRERVHLHESVLDSHWFIGEDPPRVYYNMLSAEDGVASYAGGFVTTQSAKATERLVPGLQRELMQAFPRAEVLALPFEQGPPVSAPIEARLYGPDTRTLRRLGEDLRLIMSQTNDVTYSRADLSSSVAKLVVSANEDEARIAGSSLRDLANRLQSDLEGVVATTIIEGGEAVQVRVRVPAAERAEVERMGSMRIGRDSSRVPLGALSRFEIAPESPVLVRHDGVRVNTVQAYLMPYTLIDESLKDFRRRLDEAGLPLPPGYWMEIGGEAEERAEAMSKLALFALPLFVLMAGTIILSFNSFRMAAIVFVVAFLSVGLALFGVWLFGYPLGFVAIVGTMGLVGLAINDSIVVLTALRSSAGARAGDIEESRDVVIGATRHILATTFTTMGGFFPLIFFGGRFWPPMATAIAGGVGGSSILALLLVPSMFIWMTRGRSAA